MPNQIKAEDVLSDMKAILQVWEDNPEFKVGKTDLAAAQALKKKVDDLVAAVTKKEIELNGLIDKRDTATSELNDLRTRALSGIRADFGPDSTEYGQAGGTRKSERQKPKRTAKNQGAGK